MKQLLLQFEKLARNEVLLVNKGNHVQIVSAQCNFFRGNFWNYYSEIQRKNLNTNKKDKETPTIKNLRST